jgi:hypothetical protein
MTLASKVMNMRELPIIVTSILNSLKDMSRFYMCRRSAVCASAAIEGVIAFGKSNHLKSLSRGLQVSPCSSLWGMLTLVIILIVR